MADVKIVIAVDDQGNTKKIQDFDRAIEDLGKTTKTTAGHVKSFGGQFFSELVPAFTAASLAADGIRKAFGFVKQELVSTIAAAIESEKANRGLESTLTIVGEAAGGTADRIKRYAEALMRKTIYDDEAIKSAQSLIIQMRGTSAGIEEATRGAIGLAAVFGMDLNSAARAVAQGMEGNYRAIGMLIPAVRQATTEGEKHAAMMSALGDYYQRAEDEAKTFGGQLAQLKITYTELKETLGEFATKNALIIGSLQSVKDIVQWINENAQKVKGGILSLIDPSGTMTQGLAMLTALGAGAKHSSEMLAMSRVTLADYAGVVWRGVGALQNFNPYMTDFVGRFDVAPPSINATTGALNRFAIGVTALEQNKSRSGWLAILGGINWQEIQAELPKSKEGIARWMGDMANAPKVYAGTFRRSFGQWFDSAAQYVSKLQPIVTAFSSISDQIAANATAALDNEYNKRLAYINANITDEKKRQEAVIALEAEYEIKRSSARRKAAIAQKAASIAQAIINTAEGYTKALAQGGFIFGIPMATVIAALGAIQVGLIAAQPIPLAKGGYFNKPTLMPGRDDRLYLGGEAGPEVMSPVPVMRQVVREELQAMRYTGGGSFTLNGGITIVASDLSPSGIRRVGNDMWAEMEYQASRRGYKLAGARG